MKPIAYALASVAASMLATMLAVSAEKVETRPAWTTLTVPGLWDDQADGRLADYDGFAWYRCYVLVPGGWKDEELKLAVEAVDNVHEAYINGVKVGGRGSLPPDYANGLSEERDRYAVPPEAIVPGEYNVVAIRVFDHDGRGGFKGRAPALVHGNRGILLAGRWEFRTGDDSAWAERPEGLTIPGRASFSKVVSAEALTEVTPNTAGNRGALGPEESLEAFTISDDLALDQVLAEPIVRQPVHVSFDERGRMWVVQYIQYPYPAGLKMVSRDKYWRAVYDRVPEPPPEGVRGKDKITIHEDTDGDGVYEEHKTFLEGLNIATSCARGRGGVWVLNPPYLLFYPDRDGDDVPDGDPEVHLAGFGLEDTHSVANSLCWGPDGWLYGCQGSTVSGNVYRPGLDKPEEAVHSMGQNVWRYHPETRRYEIFAEGGGNAFGLEIDSKGRVFSGHNGGNTRGFHYVQGGYYRKGFSKHGPLSNPYTFGYFRAMAHHDVPRFTHDLVIYDDAALPEPYRGNLFGVEPLQGRVVMSEIERNGSSFRTEDVTRPVTTTDKRFRPVEITVGPGGGIYVSDMYEPLISHRQHFEGQIDKGTGRIYRLRGTEAEPAEPFDLAEKTTRELIDVLGRGNRWFRQTALRLIGDRKDASVVPLLRKRIAETTGQTSLEYLWALNLSGGLDEGYALETLGHEDPYVRLWTVRLVCDDREVSGELAEQLAALAETEAYVRVRSQLACSARRLPAEDGLAIVAHLLTRDEDTGDVHMPLLLWWAIEANCDEDRDRVLALFEDPQTWKLPMVRQHILERLMRRFALAGGRRDLIACARLLNLAPDEESTELLMQGFERAFQGRSLAGLPQELVDALAEAGGGSLTLRIRQKDPQAIEEALEAIADEEAEGAKRIEYVRTFGEVEHPPCVPVLLETLRNSSDAALQSALLTALQSYDRKRIGRTVVELYPKLSEEVQTVARTLLVSRPEWTRQLLETVSSGGIAPQSIPLDTVRKMTIHQDERIADLVEEHWSNIEGASTAEMQRQIARVTGLLEGEEFSGDPYVGKKLYMESCGKCHVLFGEGGRIGPDLTTYNRDDGVRMVLNVVNPSAEIREGFESYIVVTEDGRTATGFLYDQDNRVVVLRGVDGQNITIAREKIEAMVPRKKSLMPEGLLGELSDQQIRDLFAYLRSAQPLNN